MHWLFKDKMLHKRLLTCFKSTIKWSLRLWHNKKIKTNLTLIFIWENNIHKCQRAQIAVISKFYNRKPLRRLYWLPNGVQQRNFWEQWIFAWKLQMFTGALNQGDPLLWFKLDAHWNKGKMQTSQNFVKWEV